MGAPPGARTLPPAATNTACPAAVSHSIVGPRRGYRSASPAATRQNFKEEPTETRSATRYCSRYVSVSGVEWDRETTTLKPASGTRRTLMTTRGEVPLAPGACRLRPARPSATSPMYKDEV